MLNRLSKMPYSFLLIGMLMIPVMIAVLLNRLPEVQIIINTAESIGVVGQVMQFSDSPYQMAIISILLILASTVFFIKTISNLNEINLDSGQIKNKKLIILGSTLLALAFAWVIFKGFAIENIANIKTNNVLASSRLSLIMKNDVFFISFLYCSLVAFWTFAAITCTLTNAEIKNFLRK